MDSRLIFLRLCGDQSGVRIWKVDRATSSAQALEAVVSGPGPEKSSVGKAESVPKPTQVGVVNNLRRSREWS